MNDQWTRYEESPLWRVHHAYYRERGGAAWSDHEIPYHATSNIAHARVIARIFVAHAPANALVLEVGAGSGHFAASFLCAVAALDPALAQRTRYIASDYSTKSLRDLAAAPHLAAALASGQVVPALFDLTQPGPPQPVELGTGRQTDSDFSLVIANYVCSAIPMTPLQKRDGAWSELWLESPTQGDLEAQATAPKALTNLQRGSAWHRLPTDLASALGPTHATIVQDATAAFFAATIFYPRRYIDFLLAIRAHAPGALIVTSDYGTVHATAMRGNYDRLPQHYGNSFGQSLMFATFDAFAAATGLDLMRTHSELDNVHVALLAQPITTTVRDAFDRGRVHLRSESDTLTDSANAARLFLARGDTLACMRCFLACTAIDPDNPTYRYDLADVALGDYRGLLAREHLLVGQRFAPDDFDWDFMLGRAHYICGDFELAIASYDRSIAADPHPQTWLNLGVIHREQNRPRDALRCFHAALAMVPDDPRAMASIDDIEQRMNLPRRS